MDLHVELPEIVNKSSQAHTNSAFTGSFAEENEGTLTYFQDSNTTRTVVSAERSTENIGRCNTDIHIKTLTPTFKGRKVYSIALCASFFIFGWNYEQIGPALLDLQMNTDTTFSSASLYFTALNVGHVIGSMGAVVLYGRVNTYIILCISIFGFAVVMAATPWCFSFIPMVTVHFLEGVFGGVIDSVVLTEMLAVWGSEGDTPMQILYFVYAVASISSPLCVTQFLKENEEMFVISRKNTTLMSGFNPGSYINESVYQKHANVSIDTVRNKSLYIPYTIAAGLTGFVGFMFLFTFIQTFFNGFEISYAPENLRETNIKSTAMKYISLFVIGVMSALDTGIEDGFGGFLASFSVSGLQWNKKDGGYATSLFYGAFTVGRLLGVVEAKYISPQRLMIAHTFCMLVTCIGFTVSAHYSFSLGIWICSALFGLALSVLSSSVFTVTEDKFFPVTGKIASYYVIMACGGSAINSFLIGYLMDHYTPICLFYVLLTETALIFMLSLMVFNMIRKVA